jgi:iron complex transport system permease protein
MTDIAEGSVARPTFRQANLSTLVPVLAVLLAVSMVASVGFGAVNIAPSTVIGIIREWLLPTGADMPWTRGTETIVLDLRIPRAILGALCGAGLAVVGAVLQNITRNPLADPYLFGVSSGASVGAVAVILYTGAFLGAMTLPLAAFLGAIISMVMVFLLAREMGGFSTERLVLTGVAVHFVLMAATNVLIFNSMERGADAAMFWMLGGFGGARWKLLAAPLIAVIVGTAWVMYRARALDALSLGDEGAHSLGVAVKRLRMEMFAATALLTGVLVSACGAVGFIGLIIPHVARWVAGAEMNRSLPVAALIGGLFTVWVDVAARLLLAPKELPLGVMTAAIGGLFFILMLKRRKTL